MSRRLRRVVAEDVYGRATSSTAIPESRYSESRSTASRSTESRPTWPQFSDQAFTYAPLQDDDEIRLLRIPPKKKSIFSGPLKTSIHHVYLSESPLYTAISWMWGPREELVDLEINGRILPIQENLARIIRHLQDDDQARNVWIDAICIDQGSVQERNHQVQMMGKIYNNANYVVTCLLAERSKDRKKLAKTAKEVHQVFERCLKDGRTASISAASRMSSEYRLFFENRYFTRRWIIQEVIQARSVTLCCEGYQMPMSILESMFDDSRRHESRNSSGSAKELMDSRLMELCKLRQEMDRDPLPLEELLYTHETAECSNVRDQVYALLSLSEKAKDHLPVRYDIGCMELLLSVVIVCWSYENLSAFHVLSFTCFLKQHLKIKTREVRYATLNPPLSMMDTTITLQGVIRGTVTTYRVSPEIEEAALPVRNQVPSLKALGRINLELLRSSSTDENATAPLVIRQLSRFNERHTPITVPGIDQCLFTFEGDDSRRSSKAYRKRAIIAGLASTRIEVGDEIYQFERTPLALIARRSSSGVNLIGRAYLLKELSTGCHSDITESSYHGSLEDDLIWVKDAKLHDQKTPVIHTDICGLLELMTWATYDS